MQLKAKDMKKKIVISLIFTILFILGFALLVTGVSLLLISGSEILETARGVGAIDGESFMVQFKEYVSSRLLPSILYYSGLIVVIMSSIVLIATADPYYKNVNKECKLALFLNKYYKIIVFFSLFGFLVLVSILSIASSLQFSDTTTLIGNYVSSTGSIVKEQFYEVFNANSLIQTIITLASIIYLVIAFVALVFGIKQTSVLIKEKIKKD